MDTDLLVWSYTISFGAVFIAGTASWGIATITNFFKMMAGG